MSIPVYRYVVWPEGQEKAPLTRKTLKNQPPPSLPLSCREGICHGLECYECIGGYTSEGVSTGIAAYQPTLRKVLARSKFLG